MIKITKVCEAFIGNLGRGSRINYDEPKEGSCVLLPIQQMIIEPYKLNTKHSILSGSQITCLGKFYFTEESPDSLLERINSPS